MKLKADDKEIEMTPRFEAALKELMAAECEMMQKADPENADCWVWGNCGIGDLTCADCLEFEFGGKENKPEGEQFTVSRLHHSKNHE